MFPFLLPGFYLATDKNGNVSGDNDEKGNNEKFEVDVQTDGRWALKSVPYGYYLSGVGDDRLTCSSSSIGENELWMVHLAIHPQVIMYAHRPSLTFYLLHYLLL